MDAVRSFSYKPLRISFALFFFTSAMAVFLALCMLASKSVVEIAAFGVASAVFFVGGLLLLCLGVLGEYIGRVYDEVRNRPLSLISKVHASPARASVPVGMMALQSGNYRGDDEVAA